MPAVLVLCGPRATAGEISISWAGFIDAGSITIEDESALDLDAGILDKIRYTFDIDVSDGVNAWNATGTLRGEMTGPADATTVLEDLVIQKISGRVADEILRFSHTFFQLGPPQPFTSSEVHGHFDNLIMPGTLGGGLLLYTAKVEGLGGSEVVDFLNTGFVEGAAPIPFDSAGGPVAVHHPTTHRGELLFSLDTEGDAIITGDGEGFGVDSAPIPAPMSPGPIILVVVARRRAR